VSLAPTSLTLGSTVATPVRLADAVRLTKGEVFAACQALADADRRLASTGTGTGTAAERHALAELFELLEDRLTMGQDSPGSYSMDSEFTQ
jgi:hypothetical protein